MTRRISFIPDTTANKMHAMTGAPIRQSRQEKIQEIASNLTPMECGDEPKSTRKITFIPGAKDHSFKMLMNDHVTGRMAQHIGIPPCHANREAYRCVKCRRYCCHTFLDENKVCGYCRNEC